jgi:hypothetical protein
MFVLNVVVFRSHAFVHGGFHLPERLIPCHPSWYKKKEEYYRRNCFPSTPQKTPLFLSLGLFNKAVEPPRPGHAFELMLSCIGKNKARPFNQRKGRIRNQDFAWSCKRCDTCGNVDSDAAYIVHMALNTLNICDSQPTKGLVSDVSLRRPLSLR